MLNKLKSRLGYIFFILLTFTMFSCSTLTSEKTIKTKTSEPLFKAEKEPSPLPELSISDSDDGENSADITSSDMEDNNPVIVTDDSSYEDEEETGNDMNFSYTYEDEEDLDEAYDSDMEEQPPFEISISSDSLIYDFYSEKFGIILDGTENRQLLMAIDEWLNTPYRMGGCSPSGIDCSCLVKSIYEDVYGIELSRTSSSIYNEMKRIDKNDLQEGDIVCFKTTRGRRISHVGIYIKDNKFVHSSRSRGVTIGDLNKKYFKKRFAGAGRILHNPMQISKLNRKNP